MVTPDSQWTESLYEETMLLNRLTNDLQDLAMAEDAPVASGAYSCQYGGPGRE